MRIGGLLPLSLSDYPGAAAMVVFTQGCNLRCPFCHNPGLLSCLGSSTTMIPVSDVYQTIAQRGGLLDHVVVSGGEPTIQPDLPLFLNTLKSMGCRVKLDTNGTRPQVIEEILAQNLADYIAMDVKAPPRKYPLLTGGLAYYSDVFPAIRLIASSGIDHQFRTTFVDPLLEQADLDAIRRLLPDGACHRVQPFKPEHALDASLRNTRAPAVAV